MKERPAAGPARGWPARTARALERLPGLMRTIRPVVYGGNRVELLVNGEAYFPQLLAAIEAARRSVHLETYIFADDAIGQRVADALAAAAARGVEVHVLVDGYGGGEPARRLVRDLAALGAQVRIFRPERWWRLERKLLRRLHRKLVVVDDRVAFVGGINIVDDYTEVPVLAGGRRGPRFDFAVRCEGPMVAAIAHATRWLWWTVNVKQAAAGALSPPRRDAAPRQPTFADGVRASLLLRDNLRNRRSIERAYLQAIEGAARDVLIANAYFLPGRRFRQALRAAVARGVRVRLLLQGRAEYAVQHHAQQALYGDLLEAGVEVHEYLPSYLHAKVAVVDDDWATVGSSNIDPYSLLLAREANVVVYGRAFSAQLRAVLEQALAQDSMAIEAGAYARRGALARLANWIAYAIVRFATVVLARGHNY